MSPHIRNSDCQRFTATLSGLRDQIIVLQQNTTSLRSCFPRKEKVFLWIKLASVMSHLHISPAASAGGVFPSPFSSRRCRRREIFEVTVASRGRHPFAWKRCCRIGKKSLFDWTRGSELSQPVISVLLLFAKCSICVIAAFSQRRAEETWRCFEREMTAAVSKRSLQRKKHWARPSRFSSFLPSCLSHLTYQSTIYYDPLPLFNYQLPHFTIFNLLLKIGIDNHKLGQRETD